LADIARLAGRASSLLRIRDVDEKISVENAPTLHIGRELHLVS
jgi:hypothetical protein